MFIFDGPLAAVVAALAVAALASWPEEGGTRPKDEVARTSIVARESPPCPQRCCAATGATV
jgi:hypothetical protein